MNASGAQNASEQDRLATSLASFLPHYQTRRLALMGSLPAAADCERLWGALLFIDISGFTALTDRLGASGPRGAELLSELLDRHYGDLVDNISANGGDVIAFAGDAVLAIWWAEHPEQLTQVAAQAARCALLVQARHRNGGGNSGDGLDVRASLAAGPMRRYQLGGVLQRWHYLVSGPPFAEVGAADRLAEPGEVLISAAVAALLPAGSAVRGTADDAFVPLAAIARGLEAPVPVAGRTVPELACLAAYVPEVVVQRLTAGQADFIAEFRKITVAFVNLAQVDDRDDLDALQRTLTVVQRTLDRYGGTLYQCLRDDKGLVVILAFGLPPRAHENDAERAMLAALALRDGLEHRKASIGIASGRVFCGVYGGTDRRQYSLVGGTMNLAARLMSAAQGGTLCDSETAAAAGRQVTLLERMPILVKGRHEPVAVFEPTGRTPGRAMAAPNRMLGRDQELAVLSARIRCVLNPDVRRVAPIIIEADAGLGKSTLVGALVAFAEQLQVRIVRGQADAIEAHTPYYPFRDVMAQLTAADDDPEASLRAALTGSELEGHLGLLAQILPDHFGGHDTPTDRATTGALRLGRTNALLLRLLELETSGAPVLLVMEDAHWIDSASWSLLVEIVNLATNVVLLVTTRPLADPPPEFERIFGAEDTIRLALESLPAAPLVEMAAGTLGVQTLPAVIADLLIERAGGNPFYARELALSLRDTGAITVDRGRVRLRSENAFDPGHLPETLQGVITTRIDALPAPVSLTAKVASVIGHAFEAAVVQAIHPQGPDGAVVGAHLDALCAAELVERESGAASGRYHFRHAVIQQSIYGLLAYAQRRALHAAAAEFLRPLARQGDSQLMPRLAHHYSEAEMAPEAIGALLEAGGQAVATFANREAVRFLNRALQFEAAGEATLARLDRVAIQSELSTAHYGLTNYAQTLEHSRQALRAAGVTPPRGGWGLPLEFGILLRDWLRERTRGRRAHALAGVRRKEWLLCMSALATAQPAFMLLGRNAEYLECALKSHNLGAGLEPSAQSGAARAALGLCFAVLGLPRQAERFLRRGVAECTAAGEPDHEIPALTLLGMFLQMRGVLDQACDALSAALALIEQGGDPGMWYHRVLLQYGSVLDALGRVADADAVFVEAARISLKVEPQVYGLMLALRGINLLHAGRVAEARPILLEGQVRARDHEGALHSFAALGGIAECELRRDDHQAALDAALAAEEEALKGSDVNTYVHGIHGYTGMCMVFADRLGGTLPQAGRHRSDALRHAARASKLFRRFTRTFAVARPRYLALEGLRQHHIGRDRVAENLWQQAETLAVRYRQPFELALVRYFRRCRHDGATIRAWGPAQ